MFCLPVSASRKLASSWLGMFSPVLLTWLAFHSHWGLSEELGWNTQLGNCRDVSWSSSPSDWGKRIGGLQGEWSISPPSSPCLERMTAQRDNWGDAPRSGMPHSQMREGGKERSSQSSSPPWARSKEEKLEGAQSPLLQEHWATPGAWLVSIISHGKPPEMQAALS